MSALIDSCNVQIVKAGLRTAKAQPQLTTSLFEVMTVLQTMVEPDKDNLVVAVIVRWLCSGRLVFNRDVTVIA